jgi:hypothetical protein
VRSPLRRHQAQRRKEGKVEQKEKRPKEEEEEPDKLRWSSFPRLRQQRAGAAALLSPEAAGPRKALGGNEVRVLGEPTATRF